MRQAFFSTKITATILGILAGASISFAAGTTEVLSGSAAHDIVHEAPWRQGEMEKVLAEAEHEHKPILVYWGAVWCHTRRPFSRLRVRAYQPHAEDSTRRSRV